MSTRHSLLFLLVLALFFACGNSNSQEATAESNTNTPVQEPANTEAGYDQVYLPSITVEEMKSLWTSTNQIDYIFYNLPISSSIDNNPSAQVHLRHVSDTPANNTTIARCPTGLGRAFYKASGEDLLEAEIFFSEQCAFFIFYKNGKATYSNLMTQEGVNFFNQMVSAVETAQTPGNG